MAEAQYKYNIKHQISLLPRDTSMEEIVAGLVKAGIPERTFYSDRAILLTESKDVPGERLMIYAKYFGVSVEDLYNKKAKVKSVHDRNSKIKTPLK